MTPQVSITGAGVESRSTMRVRPTCGPFSLPTRSPQELAQRLDLPPAHAERLLEEWHGVGVVERLGDGYRLSPAGAELARLLDAGRHEERVPLTAADYEALRDEVSGLALPEPPRTTCVACGAELAQSVVHRKGRYCSRRCRQNTWQRRKRQEAREQAAAAAREDARRAEEREPSDAELEDEAGWEAPLPARKVAGVPFPSPIGSVPRSGDPGPSQVPVPVFAQGDPTPERSRTPR
jgi:hypothetical protein